jgi:nucleobase:cation symporter-1, NCS1 family
MRAASDGAKHGDANPRRPQATLEQRAIDFVPLSERYGTPRRLFTLWFSCNLTILGVAAGTLGVSHGLPFASAALAIAIGNAIGCVFVAAHSAQGPTLGIPQMIQSRAQFGVLGAGIPLSAVILTYLLYSAADGLVVQGTLRALLPIGNTGALLIFAVATLLIAFVGYELIHRLGAVLTFVSAALFVAVAYLVIARHGTPALAATTAQAGHHGALFVLTLTQAAAWALSYGPYVADYSRYLPTTATASSTFWNTALGCFLGSTLIMILGAAVAAVAPELYTTVDLGTSLANLFGPWRPLAQLLIIIGVVQGNVMNLYSAYMSTITIFSSVRGMQRVTSAGKFLAMAGLMAVATLISLLAQDKFQAYFSDVLSAMIYLLVPWSAINLTDYYLVRKGHYKLDDMFRVDGIYGTYRWATIGVFILAVVSQTPFMSLSFYQGPLAKVIGSDIAWIPGLLIPAVLHVWVERYTNPKLSAVDSLQSDKAGGTA